MSLSERLHVIERGWLSSNQIVFFDEDGATVVDTGYAAEGDETVRLVEAALDGRPLRRILNTHLHSDHAGGNAVLQARHGCTVWIPPGDSEAVAQWDEARLSYRQTSQLCPPFRHDGLIHPGQMLTLGGVDWQVLTAAGHDNAMVMLWCEREGLLVSADALWQKGFGVIFPELAGDSGFAEQQATLDLIGQLQPRRVIPGHGAPFDNVAASLAAAQDRLHWLREEPRRNTENALKVLLAFKLLERRRMSPGELSDIVQASLAHNAVMRSHLSADHEAVAAQAVQQLCAAGVAMQVDGHLQAR